MSVHTPLLSVVICTLNRAELLRLSLASVCEQSLTPNFYEIIVVDNGSSDQTAQVVREFQNRFANIRYVREEERGLSAARNRGWREAAGIYVGYLDDDGKAGREWLAVAKRVVETRAPGAFGGPYYPFYNSPKPKWFKDAYGATHVGDEGRPLVRKEFLCGGNVFFRKSLLERFGGFDVSFGMKGNQIAYGEETLLQNRIREEAPGETIYYEPDLLMLHLVPARKMSILWQLRSSFQSGRNWYRIMNTGAVSDPNTPGGTSKWRVALRALAVLAGLVCDCLVGVWFRDRNLYPYPQNYFYEHTCGRVSVLAGRLQELASHFGRRQAR